MVVHVQQSMRKMVLSLVIFSVWTLLAPVESDSHCLGVVVVEPRESRVIKPLGTLVQLNCSATQEAMTIFWNVLIPNEGQPLNSAIPEVLLPLNIMVVGNSRLVINGTEQNNGSVYTCVVIIEGSNQCSSTSIEVVFYGSPSVPAILTTVDNGVGSLNVSWSLAKGVAVVFDLVATNLNNSDMTKVLTTGGLHHVIRLPDNNSCDVYSFQVTARNAAGNSTSDSITRTFPSLPDVSPVEHSVVKMADGVVLTITFGVTSCRDYPVRSYALVQLESNSSRIPLEEIDGKVTAEIPLEENSHYSFQVLVTNDVGTVKSRRLQITTSEIEAVIFSVQGNTYTIHCDYLNGSDASGCVYILVSRQEGVENITGYIDRKSSKISLEVANIGCYSEVLAHANTTGALPVRAKIDTDKHCSVFTTESSSMAITPTKTTVSLPIIIAAAAGGTVVVIAILVLILVIPIITYKKGHCAKYKTEQNPSDGFRNKGAITTIQGSTNAAIASPVQQLKEEHCSELNQLGRGESAGVGHEEAQYSTVWDSRASGKPPVAIRSNSRAGMRPTDIPAAAMWNHTDMGMEEPLYHTLEDPNKNRMKAKRMPDVVQQGNVYSNYSASSPVSTSHPAEREMVRPTGLPILPTGQFQVPSEAQYAEITRDEKGCGSSDY